MHQKAVITNFRLHRHQATRERRGPPSLEYLEEPPKVVSMVRKGDTGGMEGSLSASAPILDLLSDTESLYASPLDEGHSSLSSFLPQHAPQRPPPLPRRNPRMTPTHLMSRSQEILSVANKSQPAPYAATRFPCRPLPRRDPEVLCEGRRVIQELQTSLGSSTHTSSRTSLWNSPRTSPQPSPPRTRGVSSQPSPPSTRGTSPGALLLASQPGVFPLRQEGRGASRSGSRDEVRYSRGVNEGEVYIRYEDSPGPRRRHQVRQSRARANDRPGPGHHTREPQTPLSANGPVPPSPQDPQIPPNTSLAPPWWNGDTPNHHPALRDHHHFLKPVGVQGRPVLPQNPTRTPSVGSGCSTLYQPSHAPLHHGNTRVAFGVMPYDAAGPPPNTNNTHPALTTPTTPFKRPSGPPPHPPPRPPPRTLCQPQRQPEDLAPHTPKKTSVTTLVFHESPHLPPASPCPQDSSLPATPTPTGPGSGGRCYNQPTLM